MTIPAAPLLHPGYRAECRSLSPAAGEPPVLVALHNTTNPTHAIRWITNGLRIVLCTVDPNEHDQATRWIDSDHIQAAEALAKGQLVTVTTTYPASHLEWTARPVLYLPLLPPPGKPVISYTLHCAFTNRRSEFQ